MAYMNQYCRYGLFTVIVNVSSKYYVRKHYTLGLSVLWLLVCYLEYGDKMF